MGGDGLPGPTDAWVTLAALARETSRIRLGTLVSSATFRWPGVLAITVAQVDAMSGGRVELGLGTGWYDGEHTAYGIPFPAAGRAFRAPRGAAGDPHRTVGHAGRREVLLLPGRTTTLADSPALPKPFQHPHPPLILGGAGAKRTPRLAATYADEFNVPFHGVADTRGPVHPGARGLRAAATATRPASRLSAAQVVCCGADEAEVARRARAIGREVDELRTNGAAGTPDEVVARLREPGGGRGGHRLPPGARPRRSRSPPAPQRTRAAAPRRDRPVGSASAARGPMSTGRTGAPAELGDAGGPGA